MTLKDKHPFNRSVILVILLMYALSGTFLAWQVGFWTAVDAVLINGLMVFAWLWSAEKILGEEAIPEPTPIHKPAFEVGLGMFVLVLAIGIAVAGHADIPLFQGWLLQSVMIGGSLALWIGFRYPLRDLGLAFPSRRGWFALGAVVMINFTAAVLFMLTPEDHPLVETPGDMVDQLTGVGPVLLLIFGLLIRAALPEELLLRVTLQPRFAHYIGVGWAIFLQAALFSAGHLPQRLIGYQEPSLVAIGALLPLDNGLIAGYLWYRTRSFPLLLLLHLFAFPRFGR